MTQPVRARRSGGRYYDLAGGRYTSVTTILEAYPKKALQYWAAREVSNWVADNLAAVTALLQSDRDAAIETMRNAPYRGSGKARDIGSDLHAIVEAHALGTELPIWTDAEAPYVPHIFAFLRDFDVEVEMSEATVANHTYRYAGTLDLIALVRAMAQPVRLLIDVKTGKEVYPETALQISAYRNADVVVMPDGSEVAMPQVDGGAVLNITPEGYRFYPIRCDQPVFDVFLFVREVYRYLEQTGKGVIGQAVRPPQPPAKQEVQEVTVG